MNVSTKSRVNARDQAKSAAFVWALARKILGKRAESAQGLAETLHGVVDASTVEIFVSTFPPSDGAATGRFDDSLARSYRKAHGIYFTPTKLAQRMATWLPTGPDWVVDPSCGDGELLVAAARLGHRVWGVEQDQFAALVAAIRLKALGAEAFVVWGDGLAPDSWPDQIKTAIVNPPYVGEKGNKPLFDDLRKRWPDLAHAFSPRMDLAYLFWWRVIQWAPHAVVLASEYWLWADAAAGLRHEMAQKLPARWLFRLGAGQFSSAPGHHSLVAVCQPTTEPAEFFEAAELPAHHEVGHLHGKRVRVLSAGAEFEAAHIQGVCLAELAKDSQGFVSGFDGKGGQHGFLTERRPADLHRRPVLRASQCVANRIFVEPAGATEVIWVDSELRAVEEARLHEWFGDAGHRKLSLRREVQTGRMPWYRLHWPRRRFDMTQPKLVVPRRASESMFCLDLSASMVSSDCTYLTAPEEIEEPVEYLIRLMLLLNSSTVREQFVAQGKRKGDIFEFYAGPLRRLIVPRNRLGSRVQLELEEQVQRALKALRSGVSGYLDLK